MKLSNIVGLTGITVALLSLTKCDLVTTEVSKLIFPPKLMDFPMGEKKTVSYYVTSWLNKPYAININIKYSSPQKAYSEFKREIPYNFSILCFHLEKERETLFFQKKYTVKNKTYILDNEIITTKENLFSSKGGWIMTDLSDPNFSNIHSTLGGFDLPYGKYRCDFKDESSSDIKKYLKESGVIRITVEIYPFKKFIY